FGGHGLNTTAMAGNLIAQAIVEGEDTWRLFAPFELVWAGGPLGRAAMQGYHLGFGARERFEAKPGGRRGQEFGRAAGLAALRAGEEEVEVEAGIGAMVPHAALPEEPKAEELPADPLLDDEETELEEVRSPPRARQRGALPADEARPMRRPGRAR